MATILAIILGLVLLGIIFTVTEAAAHVLQASAEAGDTYQVCDKSGKVVAEFSTDWEAEAYVDDHCTEGLIISKPDDRFEEIFAKNNQ